MSGVRSVCSPSIFTSPRTLHPTPLAPVSQGLWLYHDDQVDTVITNTTGPRCHQTRPRSASLPYSRLNKLPVTPSTPLPSPTTPARPLPSLQAPQASGSQGSSPRPPRPRSSSGLRRRRSRPPRRRGCRPAPAHACVLLVQVHPVCMSPRCEFHRAELATSPGGQLSSRVSRCVCARVLPPGGCCTSVAPGAGWPLRDNS
jgi:hypothetical protein